MVCGLAIAGLAVLGAMSAPAGREAIAAFADRDRIADLAGFGINQVSLVGHKFTSDTDLFDALDLANVRTLASFDAAAIRARFERLPWVESAEISRVWPGELAIRISERTPFAVWQRAGGDYLIDRSGRVLSAVSRGSSLALPRFSGEGANLEAAILAATLQRFPEIGKRLTVAERVGERRWSLHLNSNVIIHLPASAEATALAALAAEQVRTPALDQPNRVIDLRAAQRIAVRAIPAANGTGSLDLSSLAAGE